jgi:hypothetical protein
LVKFQGFSQVFHLRSPKASDAVAATRACWAQGCDVSIWSLAQVNVIDKHWIFSPEKLWKTWD